jgi:hypothetical protein
MSSDVQNVSKHFASQSHHKYIYKKKFSGEAKDSVIFPFYFFLRILLHCCANAKPLPEAGNNYLGSECDHLPEAGNIYISIHPSAHPSAHT